MFHISSTLCSSFSHTISVLVTPRLAKFAPILHSINYNYYADLLLYNQFQFHSSTVQLFFRSRSEPEPSLLNIGTCKITQRLDDRVKQHVPEYLVQLVASPTVPPVRRGRGRPPKQQKHPNAALGDTGVRKVLEICRST